MNISILDIKTLGSDLDIGCIRELGSVTVYDLTLPGDVPERIKDAEVLILNKVRLNAENLSHARRLRLICITATGFDNVDIDYCRSHGIAVCNIVGYSTGSVAQLTAAAVLSLSVHLGEYNSFVHSGEYTKSGVFNKIEPVFHELSGKTWGIVGYGNIGRRVGKIAEALGCRVVVSKKTPIPDAECVEIDELCRISDIITVHTPLNSETEGLIGAERIAFMKSSVILVNMARGRVFDEAAAANAVIEGKIGGLAVDVYSAEPLAADSPYAKILGRKNVILTPHMAWGAYEARRRCIEETALNIQAFCEGILRNRVDLDS